MFHAPFYGSFNLPSPLLPPCPARTGLGEVSEFFSINWCVLGFCLVAPMLVLLITSCPSLLSVLLPSPAPERCRNGFGATPETPKPRGGGEDAQELAGTDLVPRMRAGLGLLEPDPQEEQGRVASLACLITCPALCCSFFLSSRRNAWRDGRPLPSPSTGGIGLGLFGFVFHLRSWGSPRKSGHQKTKREQTKREQSYPAKSFPAPLGEAASQTQTQAGSPNSLGRFPPSASPLGPASFLPAGPREKEPCPFCRCLGFSPGSPLFPPSPPGLWAAPSPVSVAN